MRLNNLAIATIMLLFTACASIQFGHDFDIDAFDENVKLHVTTMAEVKSWLGAPSSHGSSVTTNGDRFEKWSYYYGSGKLPNLDNATLKLLEIEFDQQGVVQRYNWSR